MIGYILIPIAVVAAVLIYAYLKEKKRTENLQAVAADLGLSFTKKADASVVDQALQFHLFNQGRRSSRQVYNHMHGNKNNVDIQVFDYRYTVGSGKNSSTFYQTVLAIKSDQMNMPSFRMTPEDFFDRLGTALGMQDIDFDSHPDFSKRYLLKGTNEQHIRTFFTPAILNFFEQDPTKWSVEGSDNQMILYRHNRRMKDADYTDFIKKGLGFFKQFTNKQQ